MADPPSSPANSTGLGTTTNPNTPPLDDTQSDDKSTIHSGQTVTDTTPSLSDSNSQQDHDVQPTWPYRIDRTKICARVCWQLDQYMDNIRLDIHWSRRQNRALFRLRKRLLLEGVPDASPRGFTSVYIFISPDRIRRLSFTSQPQCTPFGQSTIALTFELSRLPTLVLPKTYTGFGQGAEEAMQSLRGLTQQSDFTIYTSLPNSKLSPKWLQRFCHDITEQRMGTIASLTSFRGLYNGHEADVIEGGEGESSRDATLGTEHVAQSRDDMATQSALFENILATRLTTHERKLGEMLSTTERKLGEMLSANERKVKEILSAHRTKVADMVSSMEEQLRDVLVDELTSAMNERIGEELDGVQEGVMEQIASTPMQAYLTFPNHPYL